MPDVERHDGRIGRSSLRRDCPRGDGRSRTCALTWPTVAFPRNCSDLLAARRAFSLGPRALRIGPARAGRRVTVTNCGGHGIDECGAASWPSPPALSATAYAATSTSREKDVVGSVADRARGRSKEWKKHCVVRGTLSMYSGPARELPCGHDGMVSPCLPAGRASVSPPNASAPVLTHLAASTHSRRLLDIFQDGREP